MIVKMFVLYIQLYIGTVLACMVTYGGTCSLVVISHAQVEGMPAIQTLFTLKHIYL